MFHEPSDFGLGGRSGFVNSPLTVADMANSFSRPGDVKLSGEAGRHSGGSPVCVEYPRGNSPQLPEPQASPASHQFN